MKIAVAHMAEADRARAGCHMLDGLAGLVDKDGDRGNRHRNVVLDRRALGFLGFGQNLAEIPQSLGLRKTGRDDRIAGDIILYRGTQYVLDQATRVFGGAAGGNLHQHIPWPVARQGAHHAGGMGQREIVRPLPDQLESGQ